jgi:hypothetical protein
MGYIADKASTRLCEFAAFTFVLHQKQKGRCEPITLVS